MKQLKKCSMKRRANPLYRKEKKTGLQTHYYVVSGGENRWSRNTKRTKKEAEDEVSFLPHKGHNAYKSGYQNRGFGYDYTPLFMFLISKVGQKWDDVYSEAKSRLDKEEPIFWLVQLPGEKVHTMDSIRDVIRIGESSYCSGLTIDENGILIKVNENALPIMPGCKCHTHSFNGKPITKDTIVRSYDGTKVGRFEDMFSY